MGTVIAQIIVAATLGALIGLEREFGAQPAGLRTHMLVALGAALFTLAGSEYLGTDPTRVAAQVVTGIGFLGGGAIFKEGVNIRGLTTAGSLWVTAAVGLTVGLGQWIPALVATLLAMGTLWLVKLAEQDWLPRRHIIEVILFVEPYAELDEVECCIKTVLPKAKVRGIDYTDKSQAILLTAKAGVDVTLTLLAEKLRRLPGIQGVELTR